MSFSDLQGTLSRDPSAFNRHCRNVAGAAPGDRLPLSPVADQKQKPGSTTTEPRRYLDLREDAEVWLGARQAADSPRSAAWSTLLQIDQTGTDPFDRLARSETAL